MCPPRRWQGQVLRATRYPGTPLHSRSLHQGTTGRTNNRTIREFLGTDQKSGNLSRHLSQLSCVFATFAAVCPGSSLLRSSPREEEEWPSVCHLVFVSCHPAILAKDTGNWDTGSAFLGLIYLYNGGMGQATFVQVVYHCFLRLTDSITAAGHMTRRVDK